MRQQKDLNFICMANVVAARGTCTRRNYGAVIVVNGKVVSTGYTGSPAGCINCIDVGVCKRTEMNIPQGERYDLCCSVHAEMNACLQAGDRARGGTLYLGCVTPTENGWVNTNCVSPCYLCKRVLINAGIEEVVYYKVDEDGEGLFIEPIRDYVFEINKLIVDRSE